MAKKDEVRNMFNSIAHRYDFLNHVLSFGVDYYWRHRVLKIVKQAKPTTILDIATGTADLAILMSKAKPKKIIGIDISASMLQKGREKVMNKGLGELIELSLGDAEELDFPDNHFDLAMVAFGVRNFENLEKGLQEIRRVIKPGGQLLILEFSKPQHFPLKQLYNFYSFKILPLIGKIVSSDASAYTYLPKSVAHFPTYNDFVSIMRHVGFKENKFQKLTGGIATIYQGQKQNNG
ncbi:MAG: bifunctional demethylmenaquinone methyltransferase/2-methoxy-6-polyprenyl-1,4-benzoquinol methylase UbiE [Bacteroidales bacterium]|nr:bifunctional demethylmenaquinone methyltransferase/2-methoxy-6-polyprenyl-1,4-benzoquinol methylase UbiE [Bacteroidales bacterium]